MIFAYVQIVCAAARICFGRGFSGSNLAGRIRSTSVESPMVTSFYRLTWENCDWNKYTSDVDLWLQQRLFERWIRSQRKDKIWRGHLKGEGVENGNGWFEVDAFCFTQDSKSKNKIVCTFIYSKTKAELLCESQRWIWLSYLNWMSGDNDSYWKI